MKEIRDYKETKDIQEYLDFYDFNAVVERYRKKIVYIKKHVDNIERKKDDSICGEL